MKKSLLAASFLATIPAANWLIGHVGTCVPHGPCLLPVAPGIEAPSGVLVIGAALMLRTMLQELAGRRWVLGCIVAGSALSAVIAPTALVMASAAAFLCGELSDWAVYSRLRERGFAVALVMAGIAGSVVDSALFLGLAFGSLAFMPGQVIGKAWASLAAAAALAARQRFILASLGKRRQ